MKDEIEKRLQLLITISLFFPVLLSNLKRITGSSDTNSILFSVQASGLVGLYILNYILFQIRKYTLTKESLNRIGEWLLLAIGVFIIPIIGISLSAIGVSGQLGAVVAFISGTFVLLVLTLPPIIELIILFSADRQGSMRETWRNLSKWLKTF